MVALRVSRSALDSILGYARACYPREAILLLRGKASGEDTTISEVVVPPLAVHGYGFSNLPLHMLPIDFSILGNSSLSPIRRSPPFCSGPQQLLRKDHDDCGVPLHGTRPSCVQQQRRTSPLHHHTILKFREETEFRSSIMQFCS
jgi:hypothetical protein